ncbi:MAG: serine hydrolase [Acidobacteriota bacterium]
MIRLAAAVLAGLLALPAGAQPPGSPAEVLDYLVAHRKDVGLASFSVAQDGSADPDDPVVLVNADQAMPLASTIKITLLAAYAREVAAGNLDPDEPVALRDWERYYLPGTDGGAHAASLAGLGFARNPDGSAQDPDATASWDRIARAMIQHSDNAAADLLLARVGDGAVRATLAGMGLSRHPQPLPILGLFLTWGNHDQGVLTKARLKKLSRLSPKAYAAEVKRLQGRYLDSAWREAEIAWQRTHAAFGSYALQAQAAQALFPKSTVRDYARLMAGTLQGTILSEEAVAVMRGHLGWPMEIPGNAETFLNLADKGGSLAGVLTDSMYFTPKRGDFPGTGHVTVLFLRNLPADVFEGLTRTFDHQLFELNLGLDRDFAEEAERRLAGR